MNIPKIIFQSYKTKNLPKSFQENVDKIKEMNPEYEYQLWDDNDCKNFLLQHFGINYVNAFDTLKPGAFKCDFWRYAVLYVYGGVYLDIDMVPLVPLREILKDEDEFVSIVDIQRIFNPSGMFQAFIASIPKHQINLTSLNITFSNIVTRKMTLFDNLSVTGPAVMAIAFNLYFNKKNTFEPLKPGIYDNGKIKLFEHRKDEFIYNLDKQKIFKTKFEGYFRGANDYTNFFQTYFKDDPHSKLKKIFFYGIIIFFVIFILITLFMFIFRRKYKNCERTCSLSSS